MNCTEAAESVKDMSIYTVVVDGVLEGHIYARNRWHALNKARKHFELRFAEIKHRDEIHGVRIVMPMIDPFERIKI